MYVKLYLLMSYLKLRTVVSGIKTLVFIFFHEVTPKN